MFSLKGANVRDYSPASLHASGQAGWRAGRGRARPVARFKVCAQATRNWSERKARALPKPSLQSGCLFASSARATHFQVPHFDPTLASRAAQQEVMQD